MALSPGIFSPYKLSDFAHGRAFSCDDLFRRSWKATILWGPFISWVAFLLLLPPDDAKTSLETLQKPRSHPKYTLQPRELKLHSFFSRCPSLFGSSATSAPRADDFNNGLLRLLRVCLAILSVLFRLSFD